MFTTTIRAVRGFLREEPFMVFWITVANIVFAALILIEPIFFKEVIDILIASSGGQDYDYTPLFYTLGLWVIVGLITILTKLFVTIAVDRLGHRELDKNVFHFYKHIQALAMRFHMDSNSGQLVKRITRGTDGIFRITLDILRRIIPNIMVILMLIPVVLYFNIKLGLFVIIVGCISSVATFVIAAKTFTKQNEIEEIYSDMSSHYGDTFSNMPIVKSFGLNKLKNSQLKKKTDTRIRKQYPILTWWGMIISLGQILRIVVSIGVIFFGSYLHIQGEVSIGEVVMFLSFSVIFLNVIQDLTWNLESIFWNMAPIKQYFEILDTKVEVQDTPGAKKLARVNGKVDFDSVTFSYDGKREVLKDINITVQPGEKVAFVGHTGSGKTTMTNLLLRFFDPQKGDIHIDGLSIYDITQKSLRDNIGIVFQDNSLFNTTILENIRLDTKATRKEIERVAKKSHASDFIKNLSDGLDTVVGERGVKLSGGEKQRLAIARAFLKDAPILILDEATSALDAQTEKYLQGSFDELMKGRTTFIIAHRLSTIMKADRIFVFDAGKIVEQGSYEELMKTGGKFEKLVEAQTQGFIE